MHREVCRLMRISNRWRACVVRERCWTLDGGRGSRAPLLVMVQHLEATVVALPHQRRRSRTRLLLPSLVDLHLGAWRKLWSGQTSVSPPPRRDHHRGPGARVLRSRYYKVKVLRINCFAVFRHYHHSCSVMSCHVTLSLSFATIPLPSRSIVAMLSALAPHRLFYLCSIIPSPGFPQFIQSLCVFLL